MDTLKNTIDDIAENKSATANAWEEVSTIRRTDYNDIISDIENWNFGLIDTSVKGDEYNASYISGEVQKIIIDNIKSSVERANALSMYTTKSCQNDSTLYFARSKPCSSDISSCFENCYNLKAVGELDITNTSNIAYAFSKDLSLLEAPKFINTGTSAKAFQYAFSGCLSLKDADLSMINNFGLSYRAFLNCKNLEHVKFDPNATLSSPNISFILSGCAKLTHENIEGLESIIENNKNYITNIESLFNGCSSLTEFRLPSAMPKVTSMSSLFNGSGILDAIVPEVPNNCNIEAIFSGAYDLRSVQIQRDFSKARAHSCFLHAGGHYNTAVLGDIDIDISSVVYANYFFYDSRFRNIKVDMSSHRGAVDFGGDTVYKTGDCNLVFYHANSTETIEFTNEYHPWVADRIFEGCTKLTKITGLALDSIPLNYQAAFTKSLPKPTAAELLILTRRTFFNCPKLTSCELVQGSKIYKSGFSSEYCLFDIPTQISWINALYDWKTNPENIDTSNIDDGDTHTIGFSVSTYRNMSIYIPEGETRTLLQIASDKGWIVTGG